jgi:hypothetical protein
MNRWLFFPLLVIGFTCGPVTAQDTAYKALRTIGTQRGEKALNQVVAISGRSGRPQPVDWRISLNDPAARGGVRELEVVSGQISSERTPARPEVAGVAPVDLTKLNVDSDGAFHTAEQEASRNQVGFDSVNYRLAADGDNGQPVWTLELFDYEQRPVGKVRVAANNSALLSATDWVQERSSGPVAPRSRPSDEEALAGPPPSSGESGPPPADYRQPEYRDRHHDSSAEDSDEHAGETAGERANRYGASVVHFGRSVAHKTTRVFQTVGGWFQEKFTGRNTIDPKRGQDADDEQSPSSDPYSRPVNPEPPQR